MIFFSSSLLITLRQKFKSTHLHIIAYPYIRDLREVYFVCLFVCLFTLIPMTDAGLKLVPVPRVPGLTYLKTLILAYFFVIDCCQ